MFKKILLILILLLIIGAGMYYWFFYRASLPQTIPNNNASTTIPRFNPINRSNPTSSQNNPSNSSNNPLPTTNPLTTEKIPTLRHLSTSPIGGFGASTTPSGALVRYLDRGVGHVFEALSTTNPINEISNTTIPRIYESYWNKNSNAFVLRYIKDESDDIVNFYGEVRSLKAQVGTTSTTDVTATVNSEIKGKFLSSSIREVAVSPKGDRIFTFNIENGKGVAYISNFDESKKTKVWETPITQVNIGWPEENTLVVTTKASGVSSGYVYFIDIKKGTVKKVLGKIGGLSTKTSGDATKVLFSSGDTNKITTSLYNLKDSSFQEAVFHTLAEKCVWSKLHPTDIYCAVPTAIPSGSYPDDWYKGDVSFTDQIWYLDANTGEVHLLANLLNLSNNLIDATNLTLDPKENFLYFVNKSDLTLWSLDLNN